MSRRTGRAARAMLDSSSAGRGVRLVALRSLGFVESLFQHLEAVDPEAHAFELFRRVLHVAELVKAVRWPAGWGLRVGARALLVEDQVELFGSERRAQLRLDLGDAFLTPGKDLLAVSRADFGARTLGRALRVRVLALRIRGRALRVRVCALRPRGRALRVRVGPLCERVGPLCERVGPLREGRRA